MHRFGVGRQECVFISSKPSFYKSLALYIILYFPFRQTIMPLSPDTQYPLRFSFANYSISLACLCACLCLLMCVCYPRESFCWQASLDKQLISESIRTILPSLQLTVDTLGQRWSLPLMEENEGISTELFLFALLLIIPPLPTSIAPVLSLL